MDLYVLCQYQNQLKSYHSIITQGDISMFRKFPLLCIFTVFLERYGLSILYVPFCRQMQKGLCLHF